MASFLKNEINAIFTEKDKTVTDLELLGIRDCYDDLSFKGYILREIE